VPDSLAHSFFSIPAFWFYDPLLNHASYVVGSGDDTRFATGALLEILLAISGIATAVVIFSIVKRVNECVALGYIASRTVESILILVGVLSLMSIVALRQNLAQPGTSDGALVDVARGLLAVHDPSFPSWSSVLRRARERDSSRLLDVAIKAASPADGHVRSGWRSARPSRRDGVLLGAWDIHAAFRVACTAPVGLTPNGGHAVRRRLPSE
jgi:hypothetical protein